MYETIAAKSGPLPRFVLCTMHVGTGQQAAVITTMLTTFAVCT